MLTLSVKAEAARNAGTQEDHDGVEPNVDKAQKDSHRRPKCFNLQTYKFHALGDYTNHIRRFGTTDSYTTEIVGIRILAMFACTRFGL
jgi:hypothetical protein